MFFVFVAGFPWLPALYEAAFTAPRAIGFWRGWKADLMAKP